jgi:cytochrome P450
MTFDEAIAMYESRCPAFVQHPEEALSVIQRETPIFWSGAANGWVVTRYDDVVGILRSASSFSSVGTMTSHVSISAAARDVLGPERSELRNFLANLDSPAHDRLRGAIARAFTPKAVAALEPHMTETARRLAEGLSQALTDGEAVDFVSSFAAPYPTDIVGAFIGVPEADREVVPQWVAAWFQLFRYHLSDAEQLACAESVVTYTSYVHDLIAHHRNQPSSDRTVIGTLVAAVATGDLDLTDDELADLVANLIVGGIHTTSSALAAVMLRLLSTTGAWANLVTHPEHIPTAVEEGLRLEGIAIGGARFAREDTVVAGQQLRAGDLVRPLSRSADLDGSVFEDPLAYRPDRSNVRRHLVFGNGPHLCLGASLARLELNVAVRTLVEDLPHLHLAAEHRSDYVPSPTHRQLRQLLVTSSGESRI